jgi:hypothetical protein
MSITSVKSGATGISLALDNNYMEPIATTLVGSGGVGSVVFNDIPQTYKHLQIRVLVRGETTLTRPALRINSDSGANYVVHGLYGTGSAVGAYADLSYTYIDTTVVTQSSDTSNTFGVVVVDILDYTNTSKNKTVRCLGGYDANGSGYVSLHSGLWRSTDAVSSLSFVPGSISSGDFNQYSRFSLYGIKG